MKKICVATILMMQTIASVASQDTEIETITNERTKQKETCAHQKMIH